MGPGGHGRARRRRGEGGPRRRPERASDSGSAERGEGRRRRARSSLRPQALQPRSTLPPSVPVPASSPPTDPSTPPDMSSHNSSSSNNVVGAHYRVGKKIGEGSFGVIFEGVCPRARAALSFAGRARRGGVAGCGVLTAFRRALCRHESAQLADRRHQIRMCPLHTRPPLAGSGLAVLTEISLSLSAIVFITCQRDVHIAAASYRLLPL